jgi:ATP-dependent exoDNAse (exonuclease V) alpha subunit
MSGNSNDDNMNDTTNKTNYHTSSEDYKEEDEKERNSLVSTKAKEVGQSLKEKVKSAGKKTIAKTEKKTKELKDKSMQTTGIGPAKDARDIQALGTTRVEKLTADFESTMTEIENESDYRVQEKQLTAYKKLLEEQIDVIDSRLKMVKRI